ncbi:cytochrome P450 [Collybia nuda]|uniref:Cytochrome P450 n=1 Tax=Collybia nuda TaxID=64659 RepID=A0A9P6CCW6_9AGAR|nr:cytochrome P450 [Collybia nuda]
MAQITPGLDFLARKLFIPLILFLAISLVIFLVGFRPTTWQLLVAPFLGITAYISAVISLGRWIERWEAARMGSRLVPQCRRRHSAIDRAIAFFCGRRTYEVPGTMLAQEVVAYNSPIVNVFTIWFNYIVTTCPEHVKIILTTNPENYVKGEGFSRVTRSTLGMGVYTTDGSLWKFHRSVVRPLFLRSRHPTHLELCDRYAQHAMAHLDSITGAGYSIDLLNLFRWSSLNIASEMLLGVCVSNLPCAHEACSDRESSFYPEMDFSTAILRVQEVVSRREELGPLWPLHELLNDKTKEPMHIISQTLDPLILAAMRKKMMRGVGVLYSTDEKAIDASNGKENETLLSQLAELTDESYQIKDVILNVLIPQRDNVALTLSSLVYYLALHPRITSHLRAEILHHLGPIRRPTSDDLRAMKYLRAVINETLRLTPPVPCTIRETVTATTWPSPYPKGKPIYIPAHAKVSYDVYSIHTSKDFWGPDAKQFDPERFLDGRYQEYLSPNPYIFLPFGVGPRACFGQEVAYDEISILTIRLLQAYGSLSIDASAKYPTFRTLETRPLAYGNKNGLGLKLDTS